MVSLVVVSAFCCCVSRAAGPDEFHISGYMDGMVADSVATAWVGFFRKMENFDSTQLSAEARSLGFRNEEWNALRAMTADLAAISRDLEKRVQPLVLEARMQRAGSDAVSAEVSRRIGDLGSEWLRAVLDTAGRVKALAGPIRFIGVEDFVQSDRPLTEPDASKADCQLNSAPCPAKK